MSIELKSPGGCAHEVLFFNQLIMFQIEWLLLLQDRTMLAYLL